MTLDYTVGDGGSGVATVTPTLDGATSLAGHGLASGQQIKLLTELSLGQHIFDVTATDDVGNTASPTVTFSIIVTADSIKDDIRQLAASGDIASNRTQSLLAKLNAAATVRSQGNCDAAANVYSAFINEVDPQEGHSISAAATAILIGDANYLIAHCP